MSFIDNIEVERIDTSNTEAQETRIYFANDEELALYSADQKCAARHGERSIL